MPSVIFPKILFFEFFDRKRITTANETIFYVEILLNLKQNEWYLILFIFILIGITTAKNLFLKIILQGEGITKGRMTKSYVLYNFTIKYCRDFSLVSIYSIIL